LDRAHPDFLPSRRRSAKHEYRVRELSGAGDVLVDTREVRLRPKLPSDVIIELPMVSAKSLRVSVLVGTFALFGGGCVSQPVVTVDHANVRGVSLDGMDLDVYLKIQNSNAYDVKIRRVHADVKLADQIDLPPVDLEPGVWVPSNDSAILPVPMKVPWTVVPAIITQSLSADKVTFHFKGDADVTATRAFGIEENHYPIEQDGELPRSVFLDASPDGLNIQLGSS
jgi:LEA14-like dessication related protein